MKRRRVRPVFLFASVAALCLLFPSEARADAINFGFVALAGVAILVPLTLFTVLVEGIFLAFGLRVPYRRTLMVALIANVASLAAGIPVKVFNAWLYTRFLPRPLAAYFRWYPWAVALGSLIYFLVTLVTEYAVVARWCRKRSVSVGRRRLALTVLVANAVTYAVLAPLHYVATRPTQDVRQFTDHSAWAARPVTEIYYVNPEGRLCSITTDGRNDHVLIPDVVRDYQYYPESQIFLYRNGDNDLSIYRVSWTKPLLCRRTDQRFLMEEVASSPDGKMIAYLSQIGRSKPYELVLVDMASGRKVRTGIKSDESDYDPGIAWSTEPGKLFLKSSEKVRSIRITGDLEATLDVQAVSSGTLEEVYGRFSGGHWYGGDDWGATFSSDTGTGFQAYALHGLDSRLRITHDGKSIVVADNPGLLKLSRRQFNDVALLDNGSEMVFDDYHDLYLMDAASGKVGRIAGGSKFILLTDRYRRNIWERGR